MNADDFARALKVMAEGPFTRRDVIDKARVGEKSVIKMIEALEAHGLANCTGKAPSTVQGIKPMRYELAIPSSPAANLNSWMMQGRAKTLA